MDDHTIRVVRAALSSLPDQCRYHGTDTEPHTQGWGREACCDTGIPARRRQLAEQALAAERRVSP
ncbi:hypothetical protein ACFRCG_39855 [Embleya sp. NPDC056575]|uniref:hypothetical protein n=1 Tax=unclassified Embleya TaxID=2699296 RepID=UPI00369401BD